MVGWSLHARPLVRRTVFAFVVAAVAALVVACGSGTQDKSESGGSGGKGNVTLTLTSITDAKVAWAPLIAAYKRAAPNVTIKASYAPTDQLQTALRAQLGAGNAPDLFVDWPGNGSAMAVQQLAPTGLVADISDQSWIKGVPDGVKPLLGANGKTYMWSPGATPIGIIYNKQVFNDVGITDVPTTWNELLADAKKIKAAGKTPFAVGNQTPWVTQLLPYAIAPSTAFAADPNLAQDMLDGKKSFTNSDWHTVYDRYLDLYKQGLFNKSPNGTTYEQTQQLLGSGKAAMVVQVIAAMPPFLAAAKNQDDIGTFPFPAADSADALKIPAGVDAGIAASAKGKHLAEAKKFIEWLGRPENMASFSKATYSIPLVGADPAKTDALLKPFAPFMATNKTVPFMDQQWPNAKVQPAHFAGVQELVAGKTNVSGLLKNLDEAYQQK
jgi:raffinose/stachyose/melibiose transport system substrate-binding protein